MSNTNFATPARIAATRNGSQRELADSGFLILILILILIRFTLGD